MEKAGVSYSIENGLALSDCSDTFPDLYFLFSEKWI